MPKKKLTGSDRARALRAKHPDMPISEISRRTGLTEQGVRQALESTPTRGRPLAKHVTVSVKLPRALLPYLDEWIKRDGYEGRADAILSAVEGEVVPELERPAYDEAKVGVA